MEPLTALSVAGSDSGGGAGIQADLRTFSAFSLHGTTAITAVTAQNTLGVGDVLAVDPALVRSQIVAVTDDFAVRATKTGMLAQPSTVAMVAALAAEGRLGPLVVDPVLVSTSGHALMSDGGVEAYRDQLLPQATIVTPNLREAAVLAGIDANDLLNEDDMVAVGRLILAFGPAAVLVKGGHVLINGVTARRSPDILVNAQGVTVFDAARVETRNDHGTGCSLSAAICAGLAYGRPLVDATRDAKSFVLAALTSAASWRLGAGHGPIDHLGWNE
jgi:hydroxymethylpyrimidine/phosphomethylpyrimidine kinase